MMFHFLDDKINMVTFDNYDLSLLTFFADISALNGFVLW